MMSSSVLHGATGAGTHPVTVTIDGEHGGPVVPEDFAGLSFERGPLVNGDAGVSGNVFRPANTSLGTLFRNLGLGSLRIGGGPGGPAVPGGGGGGGFPGGQGPVPLARRGRGGGVAPVRHSPPA